MKKNRWTIGLVLLLAIAIILPKIDWGLTSVQKDITDQYPEYSIEFFYEDCTGLDYHPGFAEDGVINLNSCIPPEYDPMTIYPEIVEHEAIHAYSPSRKIAFKLVDDTPGVATREIEFTSLEGFSMRGHTPNGEAAIVSGWDEFPAYVCVESSMDHNTEIDDWMRSFGFTCDDLLAMRESPTGLQQLCSIVYAHPDRPCSVSELFVAGLMLANKEFIIYVQPWEVVDAFKAQIAVRNMVTNKPLGWELP